MPIVRFPRFKRSLKLARNKSTALHGESLARAIARLDPAHRDLVADIIARFDPTPCTPDSPADPPADPPAADDPTPDP